MSSLECSSVWLESLSVEKRREETWLRGNKTLLTGLAETQTHSRTRTSVNTCSCQDCVCRMCGCSFGTNRSMCSGFNDELVCLSRNYYEFWTDRHKTIASDSL